jgi:hypothetical protein
MKIEEAQTIKINDKLITVFGEEVIVLEKFNEESNDEIIGIIFTVKNTKTNAINNYYHNILYTSLDNMPESENAFIKWITENRNEQIEFSDLVLLQKTFVSGFERGVYFVVFQSEKTEKIEDAV